MHENTQSPISIFLMKSAKLFGFLALFGGLFASTGMLPAQERMREVLNDRNINWKNPVSRTQAVERLEQVEERNLEKAQKVAKQKGKPLRQTLQDGRLRELVGIDDEGELLYYEQRNANAAISTGANQLNLAPFSLDGAGLLVGVWDGGSVLSTHQEFNEGATSRVNIRDGAASNYHATHVGGTIGAYGTVANAKGMANQTTIESYQWSSDISEMTAAAATSTGQFDTKVYLSNHSYGYSYGWRNDGGWIWTGSGTDQNAYDADFGQYSSTAVNLDNLAYNSPYYLIFWAGGNENTDGPNNGNTCTIGGVDVTYNSSIHPQNDGDYRNGFDTIGDHGVAKNLITMGAANDAVTSGQRDPSKSTIASFSSTGPVDDGRIKPDLVANGVGLYSTDNGNDTAYRSLNGTSMSTPNATGSTALLIEFYRELFGSTAAMRASTLKGLLIHTASDVGNTGPDYTYGWGLVDVKTAADLLQRQADFPDLESVIEDQLTTAQPTDTYTFSWDGTSPIRATLSWTDPAGSSESAHDERTPDLVNDLNLKLIAPDGAEYFPFVMPFVGTWTVASMSQNATTGVNNVDVVEQVLVQTPGQAGAWRAEVTYLGSLSNNAQDYGLIISGAGTAGALAFNPGAYTATEGDGTVTISVDRIGGTSGAVSVDYATSDDTALAGSDYTTTTGTLNWADGEGGTKSLNIPITNDGVSETYEEDFTVSLSNAVGTQVSGNSSATVTIVDDEPLMGVITPNGGEALNGDAFYNITWASGQGGNVTIELLKNGINYTTISSSTANDGLFAWTVLRSVPTGSDYRIRITSLGVGAESDTSNDDFFIDNNQTNVVVYSANMDTDPGWTLQGLWAYGNPAGSGGQYGDPDPTSGNTGSNVIGYNLSGDYENSLGETYATTAAIDCSALSDVQLTFYRWLNVEANSYDHAYLRVSNDGTNWTQVWENTAEVADTSWTQVSYDISAVADGESTVYVRWVMGTTDGSWQYSGWNIDDVAISGLDSYVNPAGEVGFSSETYNVSEGSGSAVITIDRNGGTVGAVSVDYATSDGTAVAGSDYTATSGTLSWADGDGNSKTISVPLTDDSAHEDFIETINITLTNTVSATIVDPNPGTLNVEDDDNNAPDVDAGEDQTVEWQDVTPTPGLYYGTVSGNIDTTTPNPETQILIDVSSETENSIAGNTTEIYTGNIYDADGQISFTEHIDDIARIWIDDVLVLSNDSWNTRSSTANLNLAPGWHTIEIRISNGSGGSGPVNGEIGIGYDPAGGTAWQTLVDPGDGSFLKVDQDISGADATLNGAVSDLDGDPFAASWSVLSGPDSVTFDDATVAVTDAQFGAIGTYTLRLTADDGREQSTDDVVITVSFTGIILEIAEASISENGGSSNATVSRFASSGDLIVNLSSDDSSEATVPASVTILDGQTSANFTITAQDDAVADGTQNVTITAASAGNPDETASLDITDDEVAALTLAIVATTVSESDGTSATTATVTRNTDTTSELIVNLSSNDTSEATVPATATIAAGQTSSPSFSINAIDDSTVDGTQTVTVTASFSGLADGTDVVDVTDDVPFTLTVVTGAGGSSTSGGGLKDPDGSPYAISATADTNYSFVNWSVTTGSATVDNENSANTFVFTSADATVQANFAAGTYTVSYVGNGSDGGSVPVDSSSPYDNGSSVTVFGNTGPLTRTGYTFSGWNTASDGSGTPYVADDSFSISSNTTLYAQWTINTYTVTYEGNGSDGGDAPIDDSNPYDYDATVTVLGNSGSLTRTDYSFLGWNTVNDGSGTDYVADNTFTIAGDVTLYANWNNTPIVDAGAPQTAYLTGSDVDWTPEDATTSAWYDAQDSGSLWEEHSLVEDTSGLTPATTVVGRWDDKSGNGNHLSQSTASRRPTLISNDPLANNLPSVFSDDDAVQHLLATSPSPSVKTAYFVCYYADGLQAAVKNHPPIFGSVDGSVRLTGRANETTLWDYTGDNKNFDNFNNNGGETYVDGNTTDVDGGTSAALPLTLWKVISNSTHDKTWRVLGNGTNGWNNYWGGLSELIFTDGTETLETQQKIEGYLAWKWGMQAKLPAAHPYSTTNATSGPKKSVPAATATLAGTVTDLDDTPSVTWSDTETGTGTGTVTFADPNDINTDVTFSATGTYVLRLTADDGFSQAYDEVIITVELPPLTVSIADAGISEDAGTTTATITRIGTSGDLEVSLSSSDTGEATAPATATILDGNASVDVTITGVPDGVFDSSQTVTITVTAANNADGSDTVNVLNADPASYSLTYVGNGSDGGSVPTDNSSPYIDGSTVTVLGPNTITLSGYNFSGWNTASDGTGMTYTSGQTFIISADTTLYAIWTATFEEWAGGGAPALGNDTNGDGVSDALAWVIGAADTNAEATELLPSSDAESDPDHYVFTYRRSDDAHADPGTSINVIYGDGMNMANWNTATHGSGIIIEVDDDYYGPGVDRVVVKIDWDMFTGDRGFVRLEVDIGE